MKSLTPVFGLMILSACSGAPSEGDIRGAVDKANAEAAKQMAAIPGMPAMKVEVLSVKKLGCQASGSAFECDVELRTKVPMLGEQSGVRKLRLIQGSTGWAMTQ